MSCPKCNASAPLCETTRIDDKRVRIKCSKCGLNEVRDERNLPLLTEVPSLPTGRALSS
jgi:transcription elongation factor Elf1